MLKWFRNNQFLFSHLRFWDSFTSVFFTRVQARLQGICLIWQRHFFCLLIHITIQMLFMLFQWIWVNNFLLHRVLIILNSITRPFLIFNLAGSSLCYCFSNRFILLFNWLLDGLCKCLLLLFFNYNIGEEVNLICAFECSHF